MLQWAASLHAAELEKKKTVNRPDLVDKKKTVNRAALDDILAQGWLDLPEDDLHEKWVRRWFTPVT